MIKYDPKTTHVEVNGEKVDMESPVPFRPALSNDDLRIDAQSRPGVYRTGDLLDKPLVQLVRILKGKEEREPFPLRLSKRGRRMEDSVYDEPLEDGVPNVPQESRNVAIVYEDKQDGFYVIGHPDHYWFVNDNDEAAERADVLEDVKGPWYLEVGEVASQLSAEDEVKKDNKTVQALTYQGLDLLGASNNVLDTSTVPDDFPRRIRVILSGWWDLKAYPEDIDPAIARATARNVIEKARLLDRILQGEATMGDGERWDETHPVIIVKPAPPPIAQGELGEAADKLIEAKGVLDKIKEDYEDLKKQMEVSLEEADLKTIRAPGGGSVTLVEKKTKAWDNDLWKQLKGPEVEAAYEKAKEAYDKILEDAHKQVRKAIMDSKEAMEFSKLAKEVETIKEQCTTEVKAPWYVRPNLPRKKKNA